MTEVAGIGRSGVDFIHLLTDDLRKTKYRGNPNPIVGHCYVATEVEFHLRGGKTKFIRHEGEPHWFILRDGRVIDHTASQFQTPVPYHRARGIGLLTKAPSKRAQLVLDRLTQSR